MKKATTILNMALLGSALMSFTVLPQSKTACEPLDLNEIAYIEMEEEIDLGFDTAQYLPAGFDAYEGMEPNLEHIAYIENEEEIDLGFNTSDYLPEDFNAYKGMIFEIDEIEYVEEVEEIIMDFDVQAYLPIGFSTSSK